MLVFARSSEACAALQARWHDEKEGSSARGGVSRGVVKQYIGCVYGCVPEGQTVCSKPLTKHLTIKEHRVWKAERDAQQAAARGGPADRQQQQQQQEEEEEEEEDPEGPALELDVMPNGGKEKKAGRPKQTQECATVISREAALWLHEGSHRASLVRCELHTGRRHQIRRHLAHLGHSLFGDGKYGKTKINAWLRQDFGLDRLFLHATSLSFDHPYTPGTRVVITCPLPAELAAFLRKLPNTDLSGISPAVLPAV